MLMILVGKSEAERQKCDTTMDVAVDLQQELIKNVTSPTYVSTLCLVIKRLRTFLLSMY